MSYELMSPKETEEKIETVSLQIPQGALLGERTGTGGEIAVFKGIPYGVPPVGNRRWQPCEAAPNWEGVRLARSFSPSCPQSAVSNQSIYYDHGPQTSEDCLYLNVWTPEISDRVNRSALPVMVWVHGGSLTHGSGSLPHYDGTELAGKNVLVVTFNYRLNLFGFFPHPQLSADAVSGNYGLTDQIEALKWVQRNIAAFGGDPDNVTLFGESAGALSIEHLLLSPDAKGLFHKAILQSPYLPCLPSLPQAEQTAQHFADAVCTAANTAEKQAEDPVALLKSLPAAELLGYAEAHDFRTTTVTGTRLVPGQPFELFELQAQQDIPVLVGFNSGEAYGFTGIDGILAAEPENAALYIQDVKGRYADLAEAYLKQYPPEDLREVVFAPVRDGISGWAAETILRSMDGMTSKTYLYYFDHVATWAEEAQLGAFHAAEIPYVFNSVAQHNQKRLPNWPEYRPTQADLTMARLMSDYWVAFASTGAPDVEGQPCWPPYTVSERQYMHFQAGAAQSKPDLLPGAYELHEKIYQRRRERGDAPWPLGEIGLLAPSMR